ncbi:ATP-binding protein [Streptomyces roseifaciens]|uniref:ATP-binding protein n=1 Tax=Streptomyces roseifaciens TaxID=1488406 RepID=UPI00071827CD|nr:ATP-binding protein [Streptomyces roseifaciens]
MKFTKGIARFFGVDGDRSAPPPRYVGLADGLVITETHAEAWFVLGSSNTDLMSESARDGEHDQASSALARTLSGYDCHLKVLWAPLNAEEYRNEAESLFTAGNFADWADMRVERLNQLELPTRMLMLGVRIAERSNQAKARGSRGAQNALGIGSTSVSPKEIARLDALTRRLGRQLETTPWKAQPAAVEMLAWMIAREQRRDTVLPNPDADGMITGAKLAQLTRGRVLPYPDHLRIVDQRGETSTWVSVLTMDGFPEEMESPGAGEWLRAVAEITYVPEYADDDDYGTDIQVKPVNPEPSVRFKVMHKRDALKQIDEVRRLAKEQRQSAAKHSAGETAQEIEETEETMTSLSRDMKREDVTLLEDHPRLVVTSDISLEDLRARCDAVIGFYGGLGIEVSIGAEEQRELWLETQAGDILRVPDLVHTRTVGAFAGSWFWGGAAVGDDTGPIIGYLTGSTPGVVRNDLTGGSERGDATTSAFIGRSGRGKTTAMMLSLLDSGFRGSFVLALDFKGDMGGLVSAGQRYGLNAHVIETGAQYAGVADLFTLLSGESAERAQTEVPAQLGIALPQHLRMRGAETPIQSAVNEIIAAGDPATWKVIEYLRRSEDELAREAGDALYELSLTGLGAPFMGKPSGTTLITPSPGIWVVQVPGITLPSPDDARDDWSVHQRLSVALVHSLLAYGISMAGRKDLRGLRKVVAVPEVHVLTATREGSSFLQYIARVGRALHTALVVDTQDPESLASLTGLVEQMTTVFGFQLTTPEQQDAMADLLDLPKGDHTRQLIQAIGVDVTQEIRHGHCIMRDRRFSSATVQFDVPSMEMLELLNTTPKTTGVVAEQPAVSMSKTEPEEAMA